MSGVPVSCYLYGSLLVWRNGGSETPADKAPPRSSSAALIWGDNRHGLVDPPSACASVKSPHPLSIDKGLIAMAAATAHAAAIDEQGDLYQWGEAIFGPPSEPSGAALPRKPWCTLRGRQLDQVVCTESATIALATKHNVVYILPNSAVAALPPSPEGSRTPRQAWWNLLFPWGTSQSAIDDRSVGSVEFDPPLGRGERIVKIGAGEHHVVLLSNQGSIYTAAVDSRSNRFGQLGRPETGLATKTLLEELEKTTPQSDLRDDAMFMAGMVKVSTTSHPTGGGRGEMSRLATATASESPAALPPSPTARPISTQPWKAHGQAAVDIACGDHHTLVKASDGSIYGFGSNESLQLGIGPYRQDRTLSRDPVKMELDIRTAAPHAQDIQIAAGGEDSFVVVNGREGTVVYGVGNGQYGSLGVGTWSHLVGTPTVIKGLSNWTFFDEAAKTTRPVSCRYITAGRRHVAAVMNTASLDGEGKVLCGYDLYFWGYNRDGQLGTGKYSNVAEPTSPVGLLRHGGDGGDGDSAYKCQLNARWDANARGLVAAERVYCGPDITAIY